MKIPLVNLARQHANLDTEIRAAIESVFESQQFVGTTANGFVQDFQVEFAEWAGACGCVGLGNGTDALEIALKALGIGPGDEVIVPAVSWIATSECVTNVGAQPVFCDVEPLHYCIDPRRMESCLTKRTKAVIAVHLYGQAAQIDQILGFCLDNNLELIEDCAQAHGTTFQGRHVGNFGALGTFSFFPGKNLGALGDAGGVIGNRPELLERCLRMAQHGQGAVKFQHEIEGRNSRMDGIHAAVLSVKLAHLSDWIDCRIAISRRYDEFLQDLDVERACVRAESGHSWHLYPILLGDDRRNAVLKEMTELGISCGCQYPTPLPLLKAYERLGHCEDDFPVATDLCRRVLTLPMFPELTLDEQETVVMALRSCLQ